MEQDTLIVLVGFPRSGKTTWAKEYSARNGCPIVNPDAIRLAIHGQAFITEAEPYVWAVAKTMVRSLFLAGHSAVILDATNTTEKRRAEWKSSKWATLFKVFDTPSDECIRRANATGRTDLIPVIERMVGGYEPLGSLDAQLDPKW